jgi:addiction module HigA family antidote
MHRPYHPGQIVKMELLERGLSANRAAIELGLRSSKLRDILSGRVSITADTALRLSRYLGQEPEFWLEMQTAHDLARARWEHGLEIEARVRPATWAPPRSAKRGPIRAAAGGDVERSP